MYFDADDMCVYCGDAVASRNGYCSGYCQYKDTVVVQRKRAMIDRIVAAGGVDKILRAMRDREGEAAMAAAHGANDKKPS
jgi:hypothetical protein